MKLIKIFLEYNFNVAADTLDYILQKDISEEILHERIQKIPRDIPVITMKVLGEFLEPLDQHLQPIKKRTEEVKTKMGRLVSEIPQNDEFDDDKITRSPPPALKQLEKVIRPRVDRLPSLNITVKLDIPERTSVKPDISEFMHLFQDRYDRLSRILLDNLNESQQILKRYIPAEEASQVRNGILIGMVQDTRVLHTNKFVIHLEDPMSEILTNCVMVEESKSFREYRDIIRDTVIGISGILPKSFQGGDVTAFWGKDVIRPGFTPIKFTPSSTHHRVLFVADLHFGSKSFSRRVFAKLVNVLTGENLSPENEVIAREIDTVVIAGDLVDGIGRFSAQKDQISIHSLYTQYENLTTLLEEIPSHIRIIVIPGEHDATQTAIPQPAIDKQIGEALLSLPNLTSHGNPLRISIEGMNMLIFHGQGTYTLFQKQFLDDQSNPALGIKHLLEYRHLCPEYGSFIPLAPFKRDYLVIDEIPNVIVSGHLHQAHFEDYKGVKIIMCGTFKRDDQKTSAFGGNVSVGIVPVLDTVTGNVDMIDLKSQ